MYNPDVYSLKRKKYLNERYVDCRGNPECCDHSDMAHVYRIRDAGALPVGSLGGIPKLRYKADLDEVSGLARLENGVHSIFWAYQFLWVNTWYSPAGASSQPKVLFFVKRDLVNLL